VSDVLLRFKGDASHAKSAMGELKQGQQALAAGSLAHNKGLGESLALYGKMALKIAALAAGFQGLKNAAKGYIEELVLQQAAIGINIDKIEESTNRLITSDQALALAAANQNTVYRVTQKELENIGALMRDLAFHQGNLGKDMSKVYDEVTRSLVTGTVRGLRQFGLATEGVKPGLEGHTFLLKEAAAAAERMGKAEETAAERAVKAGVAWENTLDNLVDNLGKVALALAPIVTAMAAILGNVNEFFAFAEREGRISARDKAFGSTSTSPFLQGVRSVVLGGDIGKTTYGTSGLVRSTDMVTYRALRRQGFRHDQIHGVGTGNVWTSGRDPRTGQAVGPGAPVDLGAGDEGAGGGTGEESERARARRLRLSSGLQVGFTGRTGAVDDFGAVELQGDTLPSIGGIPGTRDEFGRPIRVGVPRPGSGFDVVSDASRFGKGAEEGMEGLSKATLIAQDVGVNAFSSLTNASVSYGKAAQMAAIKAAQSQAIHLFALGLTNLAKGNPQGALQIAGAAAIMAITRQMTPGAGGNLPRGGALPSAAAGAFGGGGGGQNTTQLIVVTDPADDPRTLRKRISDSYDRANNERNRN